MPTRTVADLYHAKAEKYELQANLAHITAERQKPGTYAHEIARRVAKRYDELAQETKNHARRLEGKE
jgi:F0F1-type ATP synthase membrane subunit b/b'